MQLDCPNDRYVNDEAILPGRRRHAGADRDRREPLGHAAGAALPSLIANLDTDFYLLGWGVPTYDAEYIFNFLYHHQGEGRGSWKRHALLQPRDGRD